MKKIFLLLFVFLISCSHNVEKLPCYEINGYDFEIKNAELSKINKKILLDYLINSSNIKYDNTSNVKVVLSISTRRNSSLVSLNNDVMLNNVLFITKYDIVIDGKMVDNGKIVLSDDVEVFDNRFANYSLDNYVMENFARNLSFKLEEKLKKFEKNISKCGF